MFSDDNVRQILKDHKVFEREPGAKYQNLEVVLRFIGEERARLIGRDPWLEDGIFAGWGICLPIFPQSTDYHDFMTSVRKELFSGVTPEEAIVNAKSFFLPGFLKLELHELGMIVTREDALDVAPKFWSHKVEAFAVSTLKKTPTPGLKGVVYL